LPTLLEKAIEIRRKLESKNTFFDDSDKDMLESFPVEERKELLSQIDNVISGSLTKIKKDLFNFIPVHRDSKIPIMINISAIVIIAIFTTVFLIAFDIDQEKIITTSETNTTTESLVIEALRKESEDKLRAKEGEIASIREKLNSLQGENDLIRIDAENRMKIIEDELSLSLEAELESERLKLQNQGISEDEIKKRMDAVLVNLESDYRNRLDSRMKEFEEKELSRQAAVDKLITEYESMIGNAENETSELEKNISVYKAEAEEKEKETSIEKEKYENLKASLENERIITAQIQAGYAESGQLIGEGDYDNALTKISDIEDYINRTEIASLPFVSERRGMDILLIRSLRNLIEEDKKNKLKPDPELIESARVVTLIDSRSTQGNFYYDNNDKKSAEKFYKDAFSVIPELETGVNNLVEMEKEKQKQELSGIISLTRADQERLRKLSQRDLEKEKLRANLGVLRTGITIAEEQKKERRMSLVPLLKTKLKVRQILSSETVRNEDPELFRKLEQYIRAYGREKENEGIEKGLNEVNSIIRSLINSDVSVYYQIDEDEELEFYFLLEGLEKLIGY
jgi:hypothetical protein